MIIAAEAPEALVADGAVIYVTVALRNTCVGAAI
jgi:hypothetical protein